jgi:hypothetical protein
MSNCDNDINSQIKALQARLDFHDNAHLAHLGQSFLDATAMIGSIDPALVLRGTLKLAEAIEHNIFMALAERIPGFQTIKNLMYLDASALVTTLESALIQTATTMVDTAINALETAIDNQIKAYTEHLFAILDPLGIRSLGGTASGSTTSVTITSSNTAVSTYISAGTSILLVSNGAVIGTASSSNEVSITLAANSSVTFSNAAIGYSPINPDAIANQLLSNLNISSAALNKTNAALTAIKIFLKTLNDISACQAENSVLKKAAASSRNLLSDTDVASISAAQAKTNVVLP